MLLHIKVLLDKYDSSTDQYYNTVSYSYAIYIFLPMSYTFYVTWSSKLINAFELTNKSTLLVYVF